MKFTELWTLNSGLYSERDRFPLWIPVLLGTGAGWYFGLLHEPPLPAALGSCSLLLALLWPARRQPALRITLAACLLVAIGFTIAAIRTHMVAAPVIYGELRFRAVEGRVLDIQQREKGQRLILSDVSIEKLPPQRFPERISLTLKKPVAELEIGDRVRAVAMLFAPPGPVMPGAYDFARAFYFDRIGAVGFALKSPEIISHEETHGFEEWLSALRLRLADHIAAPMEKENGPVAQAMMVGEQSGVSRDVGDAMRDAGLYHVLSISGLHMALAAALLFVTTRLLLALYPPLALRLPVKKIAAALGLAGAFVYLLLAGYPVPAVRSFIMVACVMIAILFDRRGISLYALAWAATIILLFQPEAIFSASFQLSFAATLAIVALYERYGHALWHSHAGILRKLWLYFFGLMMTSLAATLATTPLVIAHFNRFTIWGIAANMLMVPLASFWIMPAALLSFLAMPFGLERLPLLWLDQGIGWMIAGSRWIAGFPHASFSMPSPTFWGLLLIVYGGLWLTLWRHKWRLLGLPLIVIGLGTAGLFKPYDLLISDDATKVAVRLADGEFLFVRGRPSSFDGEAWLKTHGRETAFTLAGMKGRADAPACDNTKCMMEAGGRRIAVAQRGGQTEGLCGSDANIVISGDRLEDPACPGVEWKIDRSFLRQSGAVGMRFHGDAAELDTAAQYRGNRPWVPRFPLYRKPNPSIKNNDD